MKNKIRKIILLIVFSSGAISVVYMLFYTFSSQNVNSNVDALLTSRGKEFYLQQRSVDGSLWQSIDLVNVSSNVLGSFTMEQDNKTFASNCMQVTVPFPHYNRKIINRSDGCELHVSLSNGMWGYFQVFEKLHVNYKQLEEDTGIKLRDSKPEKYTREYYPITGFDEYRAYSAEGELLVTMLKGSRQITLSFNELSAKTQRMITEDKIMEIVESIQLTK